MTNPMSELLRIYEAGELHITGKYVGYPWAWTHPKGAAIKELIRGQAGHRCVRCGHPYRCGVSRAEWSPCDEECEHDGPIRYLRRNEWVEQGLISHGDAGIMVGGGMVVEAKRRVLTTHHLNGNKADCRWWNLMAACQRCHLTIQGRVRMEQVYPHEHSEWFKPYAAGFYAATYLDEDLTRAETMERLDELLSLELAA